MNRQFRDTQYYLKRAAETARNGVREEVASVVGRVRRRLGRERDPEPGRVETIRSELAAVPERVREEASEAVEGARDAVREYRGRGSRPQ